MSLSQYQLKEIGIGGKLIEAFSMSDNDADCVLTAAELGKEMENLHLNIPLEMIPVVDGHEYGHPHSSVTRMLSLR